MEESFEYQFTAPLWRYDGSSAWYFITLPKTESDHIKLVSHEKKAAWGSVYVQVTIGATTWNTSLFPDSKLGAYVLPIKAAVRKMEKLEVKQQIVTKVSISL